MTACSFFLSALIKKVAIGLCVVGLLVITTPSTYAGTNLTVTCANNGPCSVSPSSTALFNETNLKPTDARSQTMLVQNNDSDDTCQLTLNLDDDSTQTAPMLAPRMFAAITSGSTAYYGAVSSGEATSAQNYDQLFAVSNLDLGSLSPGTSRLYTWYAKFDPAAGNEYQGLTTLFKINLALTCSGGSSGSSGGSSGGGGGGGGSSSSSSSGGGGGGGGPTGPFSAPNSLLGGIGGGFSFGGGSVLGVTEPEPTATPSATPTPTPAAGSVKGDINVACELWRAYLPIILLLLEAVLVLIAEYFLREGAWYKRIGAGVVITVVLTIIFYWLRSCPCSAGFSILGWLCEWYWLIALVLMGLLRAFGYAFFEEVEAGEMSESQKMTSANSSTPEKSEEKPA